MHKTFAIFPVVIAVLGCGNVDPQLPDGSPGPPDAAPPPPPQRCTPGTEFGETDYVTVGQGPGSLVGASLTDDQMTIYFAQVQPSGQVQLFVATRSTPSAAFVEPTPIFPGDLELDADSPSLTRDQLTMFHGAYVKAFAGDIYRSVRSSADQDFPVSSVVDVVSTDSHEANPYVTGDGRALYFTSTRFGSFDLFRASLSPTGAVESVDALEELNAGTVEGVPVVTDDELEIFWMSDRSDGGPAGGYDLWTATRTSTSEPFAWVRNIHELNSVNGDGPAWISRDGCHLLYGSSPADGPSGFYLARRI